MLRCVGLGTTLLLLAACSPAGGNDPGTGPGAAPIGTNPAGGMGGAGNVPPNLPPPGGATSEDPGFGSVGGAGSERPKDTKCDEIVNKGEKAPLDIYVEFDQSLSMACDVDPNPGPPARWDIVTQAFEAFLGDPTLSGLGVGIGYFGRNADTDIFNPSCVPADYETPDVEIGPLATNAQNVVASLNRHGPLTATPTLPGLAGAINHAAAWHGQHPASKTVVVLITDGQPNLCGTIPDVENAARYGNDQMGIPTYVIGVISPGYDCGIIDPAPPNQADLDRVALAGGTGQAFMVDAANGAQAFAAKLDEIRGNAQVPCQYQIPKPPAGVTFDSTLVNVQFTDAQGTPSTVYYVDGPQVCDPNLGGWFYDNPAAPTSIHLCDTTCNAATVQIGITVNIALGCDRVTIPK